MILVFYNGHFGGHSFYALKTVYLQFFMMTHKIIPGPYIFALKTGYFTKSFFEKLGTVQFQLSVFSADDRLL